jgi:hypothetical protein
MREVCGAEGAADLVATFLLGVVSSAAAAVLIGVAVWLKTRTAPSVRAFALFWSVARRMTETGVSNFFPSRADYVRYRKQATASEYIATARHDLTYVGYWLAHGVEFESIQAAIRTMLRLQTRIQLVLLADDIDDEAKSRIAASLGISPASLADRLTNTWLDFNAFRDSLRPEERGYFGLRKHREHIGASAFIFDHGTISAKTLIDIKLFGIGRQGSFGLELKPAKRQDDAESLYHRVTLSFQKINELAEDV